MFLLTTPGMLTRLQGTRRPHPPARPDHPRLEEVGELLLLRNPGGTSTDDTGDVPDDSGLMMVIYGLFTSYNGHEFLVFYDVYSGLIMVD